MTIPDKSISAAEAKSALAALEKTNSNLIKTCRPPIGLALVAAFLIGLETLAISLGMASDGWRLLMFSSAIGLVVTLFLWVKSLRKHGVAMQLCPKTTADRIFGALQAVFVIIMMIGSQLLFKQGIEWPSYVAALINAVFLLYIMYYHPTGRWVEKQGEGE
ncbi:hypothetical protein [Psychrobium sp. 1_MG-2023]|uniref:hypothetical protein n=1 Tax=Psychrobium sp. 1_MG-2023 TaxID=3062624 RepID=UPI000C34590A|nr:hypothetical protein [Psychrobium sp. 1_MG-2023]MDP2561903.1 hypothetical protein [Psychrobium sp. 1_MG-2023]PKF59681.1 hypothetical protein CW748_00315 [Alteromonadales bacterium alter-6D02]